MSRVPDEHLEAWRDLLTASTRLVSAVEEALAQADLPPLAWYDVLLPIHRAKRALRMGELAAAVITISRTGLTRLVDRLASAGMLERRPSTTDRRGVEVAITADGVALLRRMWPVYARVIETAFVAHLTPDDARALRTTLGPFLAAADE